MVEKGEGEGIEEVVGHKTRKGKKMEGKGREREEEMGRDRGWGNGREGKGLHI